MLTEDDVLSVQVGVGAHHDGEVCMVRVRACKWILHNLKGKFFEPKTYRR